LILVRIAELEFLSALQQAAGRSRWAAQPSGSPELLPELLEAGD
jgi:hypothetical protein